MCLVNAGLGLEPRALCVPYKHFASAFPWLPSLSSLKLCSLTWKAIDRWTHQLHSIGVHGAQRGEGTYLGPHSLATH